MMSPPPLERMDKPYDVIALEARNISNEKLLSHVNTQVGWLVGWFSSSLSGRAPNRTSVSHFTWFSSEHLVLFYLSQSIYMVLLRFHCVTLSKPEMYAGADNVVRLHTIILRYCVLSHL